MSVFVYEAMNDDGRVVASELNALSKEEVIATLGQKHLTPIKIELKGSEQKTKSLGQTAIFEKFTSLDKIILIRNLAATIKAGLSLSEALEIMVEDSTKGVVKKFLEEAQMGVMNGQPLSSIFEKNDKIFSPIFAGMIKAGESSGMLDRSLGELNQQLDREYKLVKEVKAALTYPAILIVATIGIVILMLTFVLPRLSKSFAQNNVKLPFLTQMLVNLSNAMTYSVWLDGFVVLCFIGLAYYFKKSKKAQSLLSRFLFKVPVVKNLIKKIVLVRFSRTLGSLISGALSITDSLNLTARAVSNERYETAIMNADADIKNGIPFSKSLKNSPDLFPNFLISLVAVGEKTGTLDKVLKNFADFYEDDVSVALKDLTTLLEPLLLLFMGAVVGLIALSVLLPIYSMVGNFN